MNYISLIIVSHIDKLFYSLDYKNDEINTIKKLNILFNNDKNEVDKYNKLIKQKALDKFVIYYTKSLAHRMLMGDKIVNNLLTIIFEELMIIFDNDRLEVDKYTHLIINNTSKRNKKG